MRNICSLMQNSEWTSESSTVASNFNLLALQHDAFLRNQPFNLKDRAIWKMIVRYLPEEKKHPIIDVGGGNGIWSIRLAELGYKVICVDISSEMCVLAKKNINESGMSDHISVIEADAHSLKGFESDYFSIVLGLGDLLNYCREPLRVLDELKRICMPGGRIIASVINRNGMLKHVLTDGDLQSIWRLLRTGNWEERSEAEMLNINQEQSPSISSLRLHTFSPEEIRRNFCMVGILPIETISLGVIPSLLDCQEFEMLESRVGSETLENLEDFLSLSGAFNELTKEIGIAGKKI